MILNIRVDDALKCPSCATYMKRFTLIKLTVQSIMPLSVPLTCVSMWTFDHSWPLCTTDEF